MNGMKQSSITDKRCLLVMNEIAITQKLIYNTNIEKFVNILIYHNEIIQNL